MLFKWIAPAVLVSCGVVITFVIAQTTSPTAPPPAVETSRTLASQLVPLPPQDANVSPALQAVVPSAPKANSVVASSATEPEVVLVRLRIADAQAVSEMLRNLLDPDELSAARPTVDPRSNALILRGTKEDVNRVLKLVEQIDSEPASEKRSGSPPKPATSATRVRTSWNPNLASSDANQLYVSATRTVTTAESKLMQEYAKFESQSLEAARAYRKGMEFLGEKHPQQSERREQIKNFVEKSFDVRHELQNQELKQLKERMAKVEQSLIKRAQNRSEIIGKRMKELLEEDRDLEWNASKPPAIPFVYADKVMPQGASIFGTATASDGSAEAVYVIDPRSAQAPVVPNYPGRSYASISPTVASTQIIPSIGSPIPLAAPGTPSSTLSPQVTRPAIGLGAAVDPFGGVPAGSPLAQSAALDPTAKPMGAEQRRALDAAKDLWVRKEAEVAAWKKKLKEADLPDHSEYQAALRDLQAAKRQLDNAKREAEAVLKLLQLDLDAAEVELKAVSDEYQRKAKLYERGVVSQEEILRSRGALQQAEIRVSRVKVLLQLHQEAMQSEQAPAGAAEPAQGAVPRR